MAKDPQTATSRDERAWVRRAQAGSASDFEALFRAHWGPAYRAAYLVVRDAAAAEDIAQEGFLAAVRALDRFDRRRPFGPWLHRIVVNRSLDLLRSERRLIGTDGLDRLEGEWRDRAGEDRELLAAVAGLSPQRRVVLVLRYGIGYSPAAIADLLDLPVGTVHSRLARALEDLRRNERERDAGRA
jgi:RNA polymerase sigma-70 factor (ECF subfamily)